MLRLTVVVAAVQSVVEVLIFVARRRTQVQLLDLVRDLVGSLHLRLHAVIARARQSLLLLWRLMVQVVTCVVLQLLD